MNQVSNRSEKSSTFFGGSNFMKLNNYEKLFECVLILSFVFLFAGTCMGGENGEKTCLNEKFESPDLNFLQIWEKSNVVIDTATSYFGRQSVKLSATPDKRVGIAFNSFKPVSGNLLKLHFYCKTDRFISLKDKEGLWVRLTFTDKKGGIYGEAEEYIKIFYINQLSPVWQHFTMEIPVPYGQGMNIEKCFLAFFAPKTNCNLWLDDISVKQIESNRENHGSQITSTNYADLWDRLKTNNPADRGKIIKRRPVLQLWPGSRRDFPGNPSIEIIKNRQLWIPWLKAMGIGALCVGRYEHNDVGTDLISDIELKNAIEDYRKNGFAIYMYTSFMHVGHDLIWHELTRKQPELLRRDEFYVPVDGYGDYRLCYNNDAVYSICLDYTEKLIEKFKPDGIVIDNHEPYACYCQSCSNGFKKTIIENTPENQFSSTWLLPRDKFSRMSLRLLSAANSRISKAFFDYKYFFVCNVLNQIRNTLRTKWPECMIMANIRPSYLHSLLPRPFDFLDMPACEMGLFHARTQLVSESLLVGACLTKNNPFYVYLYQWENDKNRYKKMLVPKEISLMLAVITAHGGIPWLTTDGFDSLVKPSGMNAESLLTLKKDLTYFVNNKQLFGGKPYTDTGVVIPVYPGTSTNNSFNKGMLIPFIENHVPIALVETVKKEALEKFKTVFILDNRFMADSEIEVIKNYIDNGGKVVALGYPGVYHLNGDFRSMGGLAEIIGENKQNYVRLNNKKEIESVLKSINSWVMCKGLNDKVEIVSNITENGDITVHIINHDFTKKVEAFSMRITLPPNFEVRKVVYYNPDMSRENELSYEQGANNSISLIVPGVNTSGSVLVMASKK